MLLEQYSRYKKIALKESHYSCLLNAHIDPNPHQVNAFCAAVQALKTGGIILADEVGLGKTIEAGLVINYVINAGARNIMIVLPATLRKQWEIELEEKFDLESSILDRLIDCLIYMVLYHLLMTEFLDQKKYLIVSLLSQGITLN